MSEESKFALEKDDLTDTTETGAIELVEADLERIFGGSTIKLDTFK